MIQKLFIKFQELLVSCKIIVYERHKLFKNFFFLDIALIIFGIIQKLINMLTSLFGQCFKDFFAVENVVFDKIFGVFALFWLYICVPMFNCNLWFESFVFAHFKSFLEFGDLVFTDTEN